MLGKDVNDTAYKVIGACMDVHRIVGPGFPAELYVRALEIELKEKELPFEKERVVTVKYKENEIGSAVVDFLVNASVILNVRSQPELHDVEVQQVLRIMGLIEAPMGLIMNFGSLKVQYKRVLPSRQGQQPLTNKITSPLGYREMGRTREANPLR
ncbi:MAG TPA: GxxExxY protein [bacterium]|nr:GxxExxY protein [bacterium]